MRDPVSGAQRQGIVFYPTPAEGEATELGPYRVAATAGVPVSPGRHALATSK